MKFSLTDEQNSFAEALDALLSTADVPTVARAWAARDAEPGRRLWHRLADVGLSGLRVPEARGGFDGTAVDMTVAFDRLGYHGVPGPWIESVVLAPLLLTASPHVDGSASDLLAGLARGSVVASVSSGTPPRAVDADIADRVLHIDGGFVVEAHLGATLSSVDPTRRLTETHPTDTHLAEVSSAQIARATDAASLACSAQLLGAGERLLHDTIAYVGQRKQFGRVIGGYQVLKHALADVRVALDFVRPLVLGAAIELDTASSTAARDTSAAKVGAADAAILAARTALQLHGAVGYTSELDLSLWLLRVQALVGAWGTPQQHRARILTALVESR
ncbi:acyl-CoA dehydrogenase family protein [Rhodococcus sp. IEGM1428]|uniref:acyl-CoA dehydrogenase family protein n=1 Tax=Rhodococcus sp. IEGM1428 TaxID=3392191 RepID=UPI003D0CCB88